MKAVQLDRFGGPEELHVVDVPDPEPADGELLVAVDAAGVNFPDVRNRLGIYNRPETQVGGIDLPHVLGIAVAGTVRAVGAGVDPALVGRAVVSSVAGGGYAELTLAAERFSVVLPDGVDPAPAAGMAAQFITAYLTLVESAALRSGESVLIHGAAGGVGGAAVQLARAAGASLVVGTASSEERRDYVRSLGAHAAIGYDDASWPDEVLALTDGRGVDVVLESVGGEVFEQNFAALATFGRCVLLGSTRGPVDHFAPRRLMTRAQSLIGFYLPVFYRRPETIRAALHALVDGLVDGTIRSTVGRELPLAGAAEAHQLLEAREVQGVVVLRPQAAEAH